MYLHCWRRVISEGEGGANGGGVEGGEADVSVHLLIPATQHVSRS